ncbi:outer dense fiber protein 2-like [Chanos chanos]|uniref:Outer dense fiber protein 2-like n=1 Tax=Chanos chanos TaxID=29144 RepID=A0A6J2VBQ5_CHACN|nr:outer dense fiber protein 2-like [Chanos chanos]
MMEQPDHFEDSLTEPSGRIRTSSPADANEDSLLGSRTGRNDVSEAGNGDRSHASLYCRTSEDRGSVFEDFVITDKRLLLKTLIEAETAANAAAIQLVSFKDTLDDSLVESRCSGDGRLSRQRGMLLEKLDMFKRINAAVRQQLKDFQDKEASRLETGKQIDILLKRLTQTESENQHLKSTLSEKDRRIEELMALRKREMENAESVVQFSRSVDATRAHLQSQLRSKEGENNRLTVQLRALERAVAHQKLEVEELKSQLAAASEKASQEKEALKKATRAQKHRAEKFEAAVERCYEQLREKDVKLAEARAEGDIWRSQQEKAAEERAQLETEIASLKDQVAVMTAELQREREKASAASEMLLQKVEKLNTENGELALENATLKASTADLEERIQHMHSELQEHSALAQERKCQVEEYESKVAQLQAEVTGVKIELERVLRETEKTREGKDAEVAKARGDLETRVLELELYPDLLSAREQSLLDCRENLLRSEQRCADKAESVRQLQLKMETRTQRLKSSLEMKDSLTEANSQLQKRVESLQQRMEELQAENQELVRKLAGQEEALQYNSRQLELRSAENQALARQLEAALADVKQQVCKVKEKALSRQNALQAKILELESQKSRRESELKQLRQSILTSEKQYEGRLRDLQLSLNQSESHKQSIQNYVDFLKNSYAAMFEEGLSSDYMSSYFLK